MLLRDFACPPFAPEQREQLAQDQLIYCFPKPQHGGFTEPRLTPVELIDRVATLIPSPRTEP
jgi:hypothetical protein